MKKTIKLLSIFLLAVPLTVQATDYIKDAFGVNMSLRERYLEEDWDQAVSLAQQAGVDWVREQFNWDVIEPVNNEYNWEQYDTIIDKYNQAGINVLGLITYSSSWASSNTGSADYKYYAPNIGAWKDYVATLAEHYAGQVDYWEIWNEPNHDGFFKSDDKDYIELLEEAAQKIKEVNPNAKIVLGGLSGSDTDYLETIYANIADKDYFDIIAVHPYRVVNDDYNYVPEINDDGLNMLKVDLANIKAVAKNNGDGKKPIWLTEIGWSTYADGVSKKNQANYLMRSFAIAFSIPKVEKIFWYDFRDDGDNAEYLESNFGLVNNDFSKKDAYSAFEFIQSRLTNKKYRSSSLANPNLLDSFNHKKGWKFSGAQNANGTIKENYKGYLKVYYNFNSEDNSYLPIARDISLPDKTKAISFKAKGTNDKTYLRVRLQDRTGEVFQYNLGYLPKNWITYRFNISNYSSHWNGDADGLLDYPVKFQSFILDDNPDNSNASGNVYFDKLQSSKLGGVFMYKYKNASNKKSYLVWTTGKSKLRKLKIKSAKKVALRTLKKNTIIKSNNKFHIKVSPRPKFIQVKK